MASDAAEGTFSWRVVAKRKDIAGARLERVEIPKEPTLPDVPASGCEPMPSPPDMSRGHDTAAAESETVALPRRDREGSPFAVDRNCSLATSARHCRTGGDHERTAEI